MDKINKIKIVQLQYSTKSAGSSALRLHHAFLEAGLQSSVLSLETDKIIDDNIHYLPKKSRIVARLDSEIKKYINRKNKKQWGSFSYPVLGTNVSRIKEIQNADVIYLHWILGGFLNLSNIEQLFKLKKPVVIVMHDMWWITGGCHYSFTCEKYKTECFKCPILPGNKNNDLSNKEFNKKLKIYLKWDGMYFISPSKWLYNCAKSSQLLKDKPLLYIPNAIDNQHFKPFDKTIAKKILNIDTHETVIAFGTIKLNSPYKGWIYLQKALEILYEENSIDNLTVLIFGSGYNKHVADVIPFKTKFMGYLDDYSITVAYNAADVFIVPSLADNQPTVIMESMCCGTPVVGFNVGGIPDMITHKENGYLAEYKNSDDLVNGIKYCITNKLQGKMLPVFEKRMVVEKHMDLINSVIKK